ncbi:MAG TPA: DUF4159 domain-containing protein [Verrucomicrobiae bacterium]|nr:DUF4159 domain-containing protein [Verrucomicrobiae bacterium]
MKRCGLILLVLAIGLGGLIAQRRGGRRGWWGRDNYDESFRTPREIPQHSYETPTWTNTAGFDKDAFTFVRIKRDHSGRRGGTWSTDTPDSDLNLAFRLHQTTSLAVDPNGLFLRLTDKELSNCPFIDMVEPGSLYLSPEEAAALRKYLLNGGFLMLDDFWGEEEWSAMAGEMRKVFPEREFQELSLDDPLYRCVFQIKEKGQVPNVRLGTESQYNGGITWERWDARQVHHRVIRDDHDRIMVIATHNTDNGDGWEWEGDNSYYFEHFSEKTAYPLAINIIFYAMTH